MSTIRRQFGHLIEMRPDVGVILSRIRQSQIGHLTIILMLSSNCVILLIPYDL